jgi:hypothetical protein
MKLSVKGLAIASALLWGIVLLLVGAANSLFPSYGTAFLDVMSSIYPGYQVDTGISGVIVCTLYGAVDGGIGGAVFAWLYNFFAA